MFGACMYWMYVSISSSSMSVQRIIEKHYSWKFPVVLVNNCMEFVFDVLV